MKSGFWRRAVTAGLVYALVFVGLVFLEFSASPGLSWKSGVVSFHGAGGQGSSAAAPSFELAIDGLRLVVDAKHAAMLTMADGSKEALVLTGFGKSDSGLAINFDHGVGLNLSTDGKTVAIVASATDPDAKALEMPVRTGAPASWIKGDRSSAFPALGKNWRVSIPSAALADTSVDFAEGSRVVVEQVAIPQLGKATYVAKSDIEFRQTILAWLDKAWNGLSVTRVDASGFKWKMPDGGSAFSEQALAAWIGEALRRGQGDGALAKARQSRDAFSTSLTWLTVPYFGDTIARMADLEADDAKVARTISVDVGAKDPSVLEIPDLGRRLADRSPKGLASDVFAFIATLDPSLLTVRQRVGLLSAAAEAGDLMRGSTDALPNHVVAESLILGGMSSSDGAWFLKSTDDGKVDVALSLDAGLALVLLGKAEAKDNLLAAGQALVDGALSLSDADGVLPATVAVASGSIATRTGSIVPEALYAEVADNPWYPHEVSFARDLEQGVWAWTCAPTFTVDVGSAKRVFSVDFPVGVAHYVALYGISSFANIKLYGIDYSPDAQFESYNVSGFYYRGSTKSLYLKMRHKTEVEKIELDY